MNKRGGRREGFIQSNVSSSLLPQGLEFAAAECRLQQTCASDTAGIITYKEAEGIQGRKDDGVRCERENTRWLPSQLLHMRFTHNA